MGEYLHHLVKSILKMIIMDDEERLDLHRYWEARARTYYVPDVYGRETLRAFIKKLNPQPSSFIEVGVGRGELMPLYRHFPRVVGVDFSKGMIRESQRRIDRHNYNIELFHLDVTEGHLKEKFDLLITRTVLMHIHPDDIEAACENVAQMSDRLYIFEYSEELLVKKLAPHNWLHDYQALFNNLGYETVEAYVRGDQPQVLFHFKR